MAFYTLGVVAGFHETAAALVCDGEIVAAAEQERFSRIKFDGGFPTSAIDFCLKQGGIGPQHINHIGYYWVPAARLRTIVAAAAASNDTEQDVWANGQYIHQNLQQFIASKGVHKVVQKMGLIAPFHEVPHHLCHAASTFYTSGFDRAAIMTIDGTGDDSTAMFALGDETRITTLGNLQPPHSIGYFYMAATTHLGFQRGSDEYRVMGLASYGKPRFYEQMREGVLFREDGFFELARKDWFCPPSPPAQYKNFSPLFIANTIPPRAPDAPLTDDHADFAASVQKLTEEIVVHMAATLQRRTGEKRLCLAGGVALNCVANYKILQRAGFDEVFIHPASNDPGCAVGAALQLYYKLAPKPQRHPAMQSSYFGPAFDDAAIVAALLDAGVRYYRQDNIARTAAEKIAEGAVIGWFQDRMEWGPRSLGNRSILADPRRAEMKDIVNERIKFREQFRPFAPAVLREDAPRYFNIDRPAPFMLLAVPATDYAKEHIPAVVHVDGTCRVQTVEAHQNPRFHELLSSFKEITGESVVLNTSFNVKGEPIVCAPAEAIACFLKTDMNYLCIGDYLVHRP